MNSPMTTLTMARATPAITDARRAIPSRILRNGFPSVKILCEEVSQWLANRPVIWNWSISRTRKPLKADGSLTSGVSDIAARSGLPPPGCFSFAAMMRLLNLKNSLGYE